MEYNEQKFIAGFNSGYLLAKYEPKLLTSLISNISPINSYISGITSGKKEYELELESKKLEDLGRLRNKGKDDREAELN